jgi:vacuolar-type H+-ATPase subunit H
MSSNNSNGNNIQNMQIFTIIGQIEDMIENSPRPKIGGQNKRVIDVDEMMDLLGDLKVTIPEDIRRANSVIVDAQSMIDNADEHARDVVSKAEAEGEQIEADARQKAADILEKARGEYEKLVSEDEIYQEAQRRAKLLAQKAEANAGLVFENAKCYADDVLKDLENFLNEYRQLVAINRKDLGARNANSDNAEQAAQQDNGAAENPAEENEQSKVKKHANAPKVKPQPVEEDNEEEDDYEEDEEEEEEKGGFFGKLFGKKKKNIDFDDDDFDDEE